MSHVKRYVVLPAFGFRSQTLAQSEKLRMPGGIVRLSARPALRMDAGKAAAEGRNGSTEMQVLDSTHEDGPKLVEMSAEAELNLRAEIPGLRVVPVVTYHTMRAEQRVDRPAKTQATAIAAPAGIKIRIVDSKTRSAVAGARVIAFTDFRSKAGAEGYTDAAGLVVLDIKSAASLDRLYVYGPARYWGHFSGARTTVPDTTIPIDPIDLTSQSLVLRQLYGELPPDAGAGIRVGIVDTGIAMQHPSLANVTGGANMVFDEIHGDPGATGNWGPAATEGEHGTHVAGIIGAQSTRTMNLRGVAPGVELRSYRVFPNAGGGATNYDILSAIDRAVSDGCHVVNLSLGGGGEDEALRSAINAALEAGTLVVAAAGNDYRKPVSFPAAVEACVAVSAMGRTDGFPENSVETAEVAKPFGTDRSDFFAAFSNYGPQIDLAAPGVAIVSTLPNDTYGAMSGTSMACPAVVGFAAYLLAANPAVLAASGADRIKLWKNLLSGSAKPCGFGRDYEGFGIPSIPLTS